MKLCEWRLEKDTLFIYLNGEHLLPEATAIYEYIYKDATTINGLTPPRSNPSNENIYFSRFPLEIVLNFQMDIGSGAIRLDVGVEKDGEFIVFSDFFTRCADHIVIDKTWYPLSKGSLEYVKNALSEKGVSNSGYVSLGTYLKLIENSDLNIRENLAQSLHPEEIIKTQERIKTAEIFTGKLYPYQSQGYRWLSFIDKHDIGCVLGDEMGLGKTIQIIALLSEYAGNRDPALVICPATLLENWCREIQKFAPSLLSIIHQGPSRAGLIDSLLKYDIVITSYETAVRDRYMLRRNKWNIIVLDEVQAIKNPDAQRTKAVKSLPRRTAIAVTGTPVQNNLIDLWSIFDFIVPGYFGDLRNFKKRYDMNVESARELEPRVTPLLLRRTLDNVSIELPDLIDISQPLKMDFKGCSEYSQIRQQVMLEYKNKYSFVMLQKLRMYCGHRNLIYNVNTNPAEKSIKYNRVLEILDEIIASNEKAIIFTSWTRMIDILVFDIRRRYGIFTDFLDGRTPVGERQNNVDRFNKMVSSAVMVLNPVAGGVGLNITGASHVIHYNLEWNPAVVDQATRRAYRIGQKRPVRVYMPYYEDTVEQVIIERLEFKRNIAGNVVIGVRGNTDDYEDIIKALGKVPQSGGEE